MNKEHLHPDGRPYTKEEFVEKIKTDKTFAKRFGNLGKIYGHQWRNWGKDFKQIPNETGDKVYDITTTGIDQIANLISEIKTNPDSRRLMVNAWNCSDLDKMVLPPCHYGFQVYTRELTKEEKVNHFIKKYGDVYTYQQLDSPELPQRAISLMWNQRSCDFFLGIPFNIASYGLLLEIIAKEVNMVPDELIGNLGDVHLYTNHIEQAAEQCGRIPYELPKLGKLPDYLSKKDNWECYKPEDFTIENYQSHPSIKAPLSN